MAIGNWQQGWTKRPESEGTLEKRAEGSLPEMESTKQLVRLVSEVYEPGMKVLDVGCNVGHYLRGLRRISPDLDYTGVDAHDFYLDKAKDIYADDKHARFEIRDILKPIFPDTPYDIVYSCNVILHLPDFRVAVRNLLGSTKKVCFIRTLLGENTTIVMRAGSREFDEDGLPADICFQNTIEADCFCEFVRDLGWNVELIEDEFDPKVLDKEHHSLKEGKGTRIVDGKQVDGNIIFDWMWAKITPAD